MTQGLCNANPVVYETRAHPINRPDLGSSSRDELNALTIFEYVRDIKDPEHNYTLEQLNVVKENDIDVEQMTNYKYIKVTFTPTLQHCNMAALIGLCIRVKLLRCLPASCKVDVRVASGSHCSEDAVNRQMDDKERVAATMENPYLMALIEQCLQGRRNR